MTNVSTSISNDLNKRNEDANDNDKQLLQLAQLQATRFVFPFVQFNQNSGEFSDTHL